MGRRITRADVARHAGTSTAVVSYVINNGPRPVAAATRARVLASIAELGYRPNTLARSLKTNRSFALGLVVRDNSNAFFAEYARRFEDLAFAHGYTLLLGNSGQDNGRERSYVRAFIDRQVDGLIVFPTGDPELTKATLEDCPVPFALIGATIPGLKPNVLVLADNEEGGWLATRHLIEHGHQRIGYLGGTERFATSLRRKTGWRRALREAGLPQSQSLATEQEFDPFGGYDGLTDLMGKPEPPTAVVVQSAQQVTGVLRAAADLGLRVPDDLALVVFDDIDFARFAVPRLTVIRQPDDELAAHAMDALLRAINGETKPFRETFPVELVARGSCGCGDNPHASDGHDDALGVIAGAAGGDGA